jgi:FixJ family two-component response regulator
MSSPIHTYIAVVDDEELFSRALARLLRESDFHPVTYLSAETFLADTKQPQFDCLVLDIHLKGMSGIELRKRLVASGSETPVIFLTAHDDPSVQKEALATGCAGYFRKPDSGSQLLEAIRNAIA